MASRRDELNAYTFAKRRMLAAFLQPSATGSEEDAPRPLRGVVPSIIIAVVILAGFGAWGMFKPTAPQGWDEPGKNVIIASDSTTRYVVLKTGKKSELHPVLNMASAKLLLDPDGGGEVINVKESVLDSGKVPRGVTIGIPYAPDRLPDSKDASAAKHWAVCQRPGGDNGNIQKAAFVFAHREWGKTEGAGQLKGGELLYVQSAADKTRYVVDARGTAYPLAEKYQKQLLQVLVPGGSEPEQVSADWLDTLHKGNEIQFPDISNVGQPANVSGHLEASLNKVGMVLQGTQGGVPQAYVVLPGRVAPISPFMKELLLGDPDLTSMEQHGEASPVSVGSFAAGAEFRPYKKWPTQSPHQVNSSSTASGAHNTICNVLTDVSAGGSTTLSTWAGATFPAPLSTGSSSAYVTPGSGQLYRQIRGSDTKNGTVFLVTDTGLRYALQSNADRTAAKACGIGGTKKTQPGQQVQDAQIRLGYKDVQPTLVPTEWSDFLPTGPRLSSADACQPQGS